MFIDTKKVEPQTGSPPHKFVFLDWLSLQGKSKLQSGNRSSLSQCTRSWQGDDLPPRERKKPTPFARHRWRMHPSRVAYPVLLPPQLLRACKYCKALQLVGSPAEGLGVRISTRLLEIYPQQYWHAVLGWDTVSQRVVVGRYRVYLRFFFDGELKLLGLSLFYELLIRGIYPEPSSGFDWHSFRENPTSRHN